jgi:hypothetical protein
MGGLIASSWPPWFVPSPPPHMPACKKVSIFWEDSDMGRVIDRQHKLLDGWIPMMYCMYEQVVGWDENWRLHRVIRKSKKNTAPEPWVWSYTRWDSKKNLQQSTLAFNGEGGWNSENHQFWSSTEFHPVFPFSRAPPLLVHIFWRLLTVQLL